MERRVSLGPSLARVVGGHLPPAQQGDGPGQLQVAGPRHPVQGEQVLLQQSQVTPCCGHQRGAQPALQLRGHGVRHLFDVFLTIFATFANTNPDPDPSKLAPTKNLIK